MQQSSRTKTKQKSRTDAAGTIRAGQSRSEAPGTIVEQLQGNSIEYWKNRVYEAIEQYKQEYNYSDSELELMKQLKWNSVLIYICSHVFKINDQRTYNVKDIQLLSDIADLYINICLRYIKTVSLHGFSHFIGIDASILYRWYKKENRTVLYIDNTNNRILDSTEVTLYKIRHPECALTELLNNEYYQLCKKIVTEREHNLTDKTEDGSIPSLALGKIEYGWIEGKDKQLQAKLIESYVQPSNLLDKYD